MPLIDQYHIISNVRRRVRQELAIIVSYNYQGIYDSMLLIDKYHILFNVQRRVRQELLNIT